MATQEKTVEQLKKERRRRPIFAVVGLLVFLVVYIDDWGRDFTTHEATISHDNADETLRPLEYARSRDLLAEAVKMGGQRIKNWEYIGEAAADDTTLLTFVRTNRLLRFKDDITIRVQQLDDHCEISGVSISRFGYGDLGRNPRNLRRILEETRTVLNGSAHTPALQVPRTAP
jgi:uncharacterized protein (DUF1499 family)